MNGKTLKLVMLLLKRLPDKVAMKIMAAFFDIIEEEIVDSRSVMDDIFLLPVLKELREMLGIKEKPKNIVIHAPPPDVSGDKIKSAMDLLKK